MSTGRRIFSTAALLGLVVLVVLFAAGKFGGERTPPGRGEASAGPAAPAATAPAERVSEDVFEEAVGTVTSRTRVVVSAQVPGRITDVMPRVGEDVRAGAPAVALDDREFVARAEQAREALAAAQAARRQAEQAKAQSEARLTLARSRFDRVQQFVARGAATTEQLEAAQADLAQATAGVATADAAIAAADAGIAQARQGIAAADVSVGHTRIAIPLDGVVAERGVEPGDLAWPGRPLLVVLDPKELRLDAQVREGLIPQVVPGTKVRVDVPAARRTIEGDVSQVVPSADPRSRTFEVRIALPATPDLRPGMFGRVRFRVGSREVVRVPAAAVRRVGQLETVLVRDGDRWARRLVTTGAADAAGRVEVLSGLRGGETVGAGTAGDGR